MTTFLALLLLQADAFSVQSPSGPASVDIPASLPLIGTPSVTYAAVLAVKPDPAATPTPAVYAVAVGAGAFVQVPAAGFAVIGSPAVAQVSFESPVLDGLSLVRIDHFSPLGSPSVWTLRISTAAGAPATPFRVRIAHTLALAQAAAFSVHVGAHVYSDTVAGADGPLSAAAVDFGAVPSGLSSARVLRLQNSGTGPMTLDAAAFPLNPGGSFSVSGFVPAAVLAPNGFQDLDLGYAPVGGPGVHAGTLEMTTLAGPPALPVALTGTAGPAPPDSSGGRGGCGLTGLEVLLLLLCLPRRSRDSAP